MKGYVYVAGPLGKEEENVEAACKAAGVLADAGYVPYLPHLTYYFEQHIGSRSRVFWLAQDFAWLRVCDALLRLPGDSAGADAEVAFALHLGIPVHYTLEGLFHTEMAKEDCCDR